jgi:hypothetical protein
MGRAANSPCDLPEFADEKIRGTGDGEELPG